MSQVQGHVWPAQHALCLRAHEEARGLHSHTPQPEVNGHSGSPLRWQRSREQPSPPWGLHTQLWFAGLPSESSCMALCCVPHQGCCGALCRTGRHVVLPRAPPPLHRSCTVRSVSYSSHCIACSHRSHHMDEPVCTSRALLAFSIFHFMNPATGQFDVQRALQYEAAQVLKSLRV